MRPANERAGEGREENCSGQWEPQVQTLRWEQSWHIPEWKENSISKAQEMGREADGLQKAVRVFLGIAGLWCKVESWQDFKQGNNVTQVLFTESC